jgi:hypothetical protein
MKLQSALLRRAFRVDAEAAPGFYAKVMNRIETQAKPSVWTLFAESMFAKRLAYASATFLVLVGTVLVSSNQSDQPLMFNDPQVILAGEENYMPVSMEEPDRDREVVLVNLTTYQDYQ